ncbi:hypothetical protein KP509_09G063000 [Ceratopteris richardii]|nr:hypothetical protein KP509_09G063000 [Ceratopteris richardii]
MGLPHDFLQPLEGTHQNFSVPQATPSPGPLVSRSTTQKTVNKPFRQFWKAGDYESDKGSHKSSGGMDHVRVHPKFLHSNATSHKWALGAIAELLDNALDEITYGATSVHVDMIRNPKNGEPMLLVEDDGGGMNPDSMRQCMSLGYSMKSKMANTIGQYGNGFKTSTMRLGADVIVFSRCTDNKGLGPTESIGLLSYTFLRETGQQDIIVPMIDYEIKPFGLRKLVRRNVDDWNRNMETIKCWSPYATESELMDHFRKMKEHGTKIIIFNLWEDDQGNLELDFDSDRYDIQLRGVNKNEKHVTMAERFPNSSHYLTYQHSLRSYASILYLKLPSGFKIFLRGKEVEHHNLIDDLMFTEVWTYRPMDSDVKQTDNSQMKAVVTVGFVKDAKEHIDVQGFNVYHKNRLIKPFWRLWNSAASRGRGIIGVLEANFVEPAHDKQGFERTIVLARLEARLVEMQKSYWSKHCHKVGYVNSTLKSKEGRAVERRTALSSPIEAGQPALVAPLALLPPARASDVETHASNALSIPTPLAIAWSTQLQTQVQLARPAHGLSETNSSLMQQVNSQSIPLYASSAGISYNPPYRPNMNSAVLVSSSPLQKDVGQPHLQPSGQFHGAIRTPLPPPAVMSKASSMPAIEKPSTQCTPGHFLNSTYGSPADVCRVSSAQSMQISSGQPKPLHDPIHDACSPLPGDAMRNIKSMSEPESVRPITPSSESSKVSQVSQLSSRHCSLSTVQGIQSISSDSSPLADSTCNTSSSRANLTENMGVQPPVSDVQAGRPRTESPHSPHAVPQKIAVAQTFASVLANPGRNDHGPQVQVNEGSGNTNLQRPNLLEKDALLSTVDMVMTSTQVTGARESSEAAICVAEGKEQLQISSQILSKVDKCGALKGQTVELDSLNMSTQQKNDIVEGSCILNVTPGTSSTVAQVIQSPPEHGSLKSSRLPGKKSLEDLGRLFVRQATSSNVNQSEKSKQLRVLENECTKSDVTGVTNISKSCSNKELECRLIGLEQEVKDLQHKLESLTTERDSLRHRLFEERHRGQLSKQELQNKVEQAWAKVRELEAKNGLT